jgi:putative transcriptional regulator
VIVIRFKLKELLAEKSFQEDRRVSIDEVSQATEIHRTTLSKLVNKKGYNSTTDIIDKLCAFFNVKIEQVIEYIDEPKQNN